MMSKHGPGNPNLYIISSMTKIFSIGDYNSQQYFGILQSPVYNCKKNFAISLLIAVLRDHVQAINCGKIGISK